MDTIRGWVPRPEKPLNQNWNDDLREARQGIMLHYDASMRDNPGVDWVKYHPDARGSYQWMVLDSGQIVEVAPKDARAWHAGNCRPSPFFEGLGLDYFDANSAFYGIAVTATDGDQVTPRQMESVVSLCHTLCAEHEWSADRITGHHNEAWPRGRKIDPVGSDPDNPVLSVVDVRHAVAARLQG